MNWIKTISAAHTRSTQCMDDDDDDDDDDDGDDERERERCHTFVTWFRQDSQTRK